jgi:hypothetical protein
MIKEAQKLFFLAKALEKRNSKCTQYNVNQICADDSGSDQEEQDEDASTSRSTDTSNWTSADWLDYQSGALVPGPNFW